MAAQKMADVVAELAATKNELALLRLSETPLASSSTPASVSYDDNDEADDEAVDGADNEFLCHYSKGGNMCSITTRAVKGAYMASPNATPK